jgi:hypothetical protein
MNTLNLQKLKISEIKTLLNEQGIEYPAKATKAELILLVPEESDNGPDIPDTGEHYVEEIAPTQENEISEGAFEIFVKKISQDKQMHAIIVSLATVLKSLKNFNDVKYQVGGFTKRKKSSVVHLILLVFVSAFEQVLSLVESEEFMGAEEFFNAFCEAENIQAIETIEGILAEAQKAKSLMSMNGLSLLDDGVRFLSAYNKKSFFEFL